AITATEKSGKIISPVTGQAAYITTYAAFKTLSSNMTSYIQFDGSISKTNINNSSVKISWPAALVCTTSGSCQESTKFRYEIRSADNFDHIFCQGNDTQCVINNLDSN